MTAEVTLYRCYWPAAFAYLKANSNSFQAKAYDLLMTLEVGLEHAYSLAFSLPTGAVIDVVPINPTPLETQDIDDLLFYGHSENAVGFDKN